MYRGAECLWCLKFFFFFLIQFIIYSTQFSFCLAFYRFVFVGFVFALEVFVFVLAGLQGSDCGVWVVQNRDVLVNQFCFFCCFLMCLICSTLFLLLLFFLLNIFVCVFLCFPLFFCFFCFFVKHFCFGFGKRCFTRKEQFLDTVSKLMDGLEVNFEFKITLSVLVC